MLSSAQHLEQSIEWAIVFQEMFILQGTPLPPTGQPSQVWARETCRGWDAAEVDCNTSGPAFRPLSMCN